MASRQGAIPSWSWIAVALLVVVLVQGEEDHHLLLTNFTHDNNSSVVVPVTCPSTQTVFTALTEMVLEGRDELLSMDERLALREKFINIYNGLTESNCDAYFRRLANLTMVSMSNQVGDVVDHSATLGLETQSRRQGQRWLQTEAPSIEDLNSSTTSRNGGVNVIYQVQGTCRDCPITESGSLDLYDDAFRRNLNQQAYTTDNNIRVRLRMLQVISVSTRNLQEHDNQDCACVEGALPEQPQAPGVQECVDEMNVAFMKLRTQLGLFQNLNMSDLLQLDDLNDTSTTSTTTTGTPTSTSTPTIITTITPTTYTTIPTITATITTTTTTPTTTTAPTDVSVVNRDVPIIWGRDGKEEPDTSAKVQQEPTFEAHFTVDLMSGTSDARTWLQHGNGIFLVVLAMISIIWHGRY